MALSVTDKIYGEIAFSGITLPNGDRMTFSDPSMVARYIKNNGDFPADSSIGGKSYASVTASYQAADAASSAASSAATIPNAVPPADPVVPTATTPTATTPTATSSVITPPLQAFDDGSTLQTFDDGSTLAVGVDGSVTSTPAPTTTSATIENAVNPPTVGLNLPSATSIFNSIGATISNDVSAIAKGLGLSSITGQQLPSGLNFGAQPATTKGATASWAGAKDMRVKLRVPAAYLQSPLTAGPSNTIKNNSGILFPFTPTISVANQATYANQSPVHSNFGLYFYQKSLVGPITVTGKFTVQNEYEGAVLLGVIHLLRSLTKMKFGDDPDAGAPPPVCRLDAWGDYMLYNVPVSVASWTHDLPDGVDYIQVGKQNSPTTYGHSMVPTVSSISITLNVMYSRQEMLQYNVRDWLAGGLQGKGYL